MYFQKSSDILNPIYYIATFILVFLSIVAKNERLLLYSFEVFYLILISTKVLRENLHIKMYTLWSISFFVICLFSYIYAVDQNIAFKQIFNVSKILLIGNSVLFFINKDSKKLDFILVSIIISTLYLSLLLVIKTPLQYWGTARLGGNIGLNANALGLNMAFSAIITLFYAKSKSKVYLYILALMFITITLFSGSRKAFLLILIGIFFLYILTTKNKFKLFAIVLPVITITFVISWNLIMNIPKLYNVLGIRIEQMVNGVLGRGIVDDSTETRLGMIETGLQLFKDKPIMGYGIRNYEVLTSFGYAHNNYIELLVGIGLIGTFVYYSLYAGILYKLLNAIKKNKYAGLFISLVLGLMIMEYGLVSYYVEFYQILLVCAYSAIYIKQ